MIKPSDVSAFLFRRLIAKFLSRLAQNDLNLKKITVYLRTKSGCSGFIGEFFVSIIFKKKKKF